MMIFRGELEARGHAHTAGFRSKRHDEVFYVLYIYISQ
jgi:hypothetical protein